MLPPQSYGAQATCSTEHTMSGCMVMVSGIIYVELVSTGGGTGETIECVYHSSSYLKHFLSQTSNIFIAAAKLAQKGRNNKKNYKKD